MPSSSLASAAKTSCAWVLEIVWNAPLPNSGWGLTMPCAAFLVSWRSSYPLMQWEPSIRFVNPASTSSRLENQHHRRQLRIALLRPPSCCKESRWELPVPFTRLDLGLMEKNLQSFLQQVDLLGPVLLIQDFPDQPVTAFWANFLNFYML